MKFGFPLFFFAIWPGGRRCANCRNAHFLRGTVMKASSHEKHAHEINMQKNMGLLFFFGFSMVFLWNKQKKQKVQTHGQGLGRGLAGDMGLNFLFFFVVFVFFWFFHCFLQFGQNLEKTKKNKTKSSDPWARSGERPGWGHGSELFVFFFFFPLFFCSLAKTSRKPKKTKKKNKKFRPMGKVSGEAWLGTWV